MKTPAKQDLINFILAQPDDRPVDMMDGHILNVKSNFSTGCLLAHYCIANESDVHYVTLKSFQNENFDGIAYLEDEGYIFVRSLVYCQTYGEMKALID
jgi:hypothetical protein